VDVTSLPGLDGTAHTTYVIEAPDGAAYQMDSYFYKAEITRVRRVFDHYYTPTEVNHNLAGYGYTGVFGNPECLWKIVTDDYNAYFDKSKTLDKRGTGGKTAFLTSYDPNDIQGPAGSGTARYANASSVMNYTVRFENVETAALAAAEVRVDGVLDGLLLDLGSVQFDRVQFGEHEIAVPETTQDFTTDVDLRPGQNLVVRVHAWLDMGAGSVRWTFMTLDADTLAPPDDFSAGFLPPDTNPPAGEGSVSFSVRPRNDLRTGDKISTYAVIQFDMNDTMDTPVWTNTIDNTVPDSTVNALPATVDTPSFDVAWTGADADSGVAAYTLYAAVDGGGFTPLSTEKTAGSFAFEGGYGHSYAFYTIAEDAAGNRQPVPATAQASVTVNPAPAEGEGEGEGEGGNGTGCQGCNKGTTPTNSKGDHATLALAGVLMAVGSLAKRRLGP